MKRRTLVILTLLVGGLGGTITWQALKPKDPTTVVISKVERVPTLRSVVSATGEIRAKEFVDIQAEVAGVITELLVREGDTVEKGTVLLRLEELQVKAAEDQARAQVGAAEAEAKNAEVGVATALANLAAEETALANYKVELEQARTTRDRSQASLVRKKELFEKELLGMEEYEVAQADARIALQRFEWFEARVRQGAANLNAVGTRVDAARSVLDGSLKRIEAAKAQLASASDMVTKTVLRAPLTGLVTKLNVEKGERAVPGIQSNPIATLMTIADMSVIEAEISVDEADIVTVTLGALAEVETDALRDVKIQGVVTEIGQSPIQPSSTGSSGNLNQSQEGKDFKVVVRLTSPPPVMRPGFTATADIVTATRTDVLVVPFAAIVEREVEIDAKGTYVPPPEPVGDDFVPTVSASRRQNYEEKKGVFVKVDGKARFRPVKQGIMGDMDVEVLEGLQPDEEVISGPTKTLQTLKEWDPVVVDEKKAAEDARRLRSRRR